MFNLSFSINVPNNRLNQDMIILSYPNSLLLCTKLTRENENGMMKRLNLSKVCLKNPFYGMREFDNTII